MIYSTSEFIYHGKNIGNPSIDHDLKLQVQSLGILNSCNYFSNALIFNIKTIIHSRRNFSVENFQRQIFARSNINNCVVISPGRLANEQRAIHANEQRAIHANAREQFP